MLFESGRSITISLVQRNDQDLVTATFKVDYRQAIAERRMEIERAKEIIEQEAALLIQQEQMGAQPVVKGKKDAKKNGKTIATISTNPNEQDFSVKLFNVEEHDNSKVFIFTT